MEHTNKYSNPYLFTSREACEAGDSRTSALMKKTFAPYFAAKLYVSASFSGTFYMSKQSSLPYTAQSQYYKDMELLGTNSSNLEGNNWDNSLTGNASDNKLTGGKGNDILAGGIGNDRAIYAGNRSDYTITTSGNVTMVTDNVAGRDGEDSLTEIEEIQFLDQTISSF